MVDVLKDGIIHKEQITSNTQLFREVSRPLSLILALSLLACRPPVQTDTNPTPTPTPPQNAFFNVQIICVADGVSAMVGNRYTQHPSVIPYVELVEIRRENNPMCSYPKITDKFCFNPEQPGCSEPGVSLPEEE